MSRESYREALLDPRWQKKRLEIFQRDGFKCRWCGVENLTLHVHHFKYGDNPWDGDDEDKVTMCAECHRRAHFQEKLMKMGDEWFQEVPEDEETRQAKGFIRCLDIWKQCWLDYLNKNEQTSQERKEAQA